MLVLLPTFADIINAAFETFGGIFICLNIFTLWKDKQVKGVNWGSTIFFTLWGFWNVWYYPFLGQGLSFIGGIFLCGANVVWLLMRLYYQNSQSRQNETDKSSDH